MPEKPLDPFSERSQISVEIADNFPAKKERKVLLVEDCEVDKQTYRRYLDSDPDYEYSFIEVESGKEALEAYRREPIDIVLLDYLLPDMDGLQWLALWQQQTDENRPPVIVLTGQGDERIAVQFIRLGAADYLVKDRITPEKLMLAVSRAIAEAELRKQLRNTFEQAAVGIAHVAPDGRWLRVNQKLCEIVGYSEGELLQKKFQDITHPQDLASDLDLVRQMLAGEIRTYSMTKRYIRKDESLVWVNLTVSLVRDNCQQPDYFIAVVEDISERQAALRERKQLEFSLQKSLRRLNNLYQIDKAILKAEDPQAIAQIAISSIQKLISCQRTSIVTFDRENDTATILVTQGKGDKVVGNGVQVCLEVWQNLIERLEDEDRPHIVSDLKEYPQLSVEFPALKREKLHDFISFPLKVGKSLLGIVKLWSDNLEAITSEDLEIVTEMSDRVAIALQQARLSQQAQRYALELETSVAQRTAQLEDINQELKAFSYSISHDLKAPLRAIQGFTTAIQEDYSENLDALGREYIERLVTSAQQMEKLIQDLLAYSRLSRTEIQVRPIELSEVVKQAIEQLEVEIGEAKARIIVEEPLSTISGNKTILLQVVTNLLSNAIKFVNPNVIPQIRIWTASTGDRLSKQTR